MISKGQNNLIISELGNQYCSNVPSNQLGTCKQSFGNRLRNNLNDELFENWILPYIGTSMFYIATLVDATVDSIQNRTYKFKFRFFNIVQGVEWFNWSINVPMNKMNDWQYIINNMSSGDVSYFYHSAINTGQFYVRTLSPETYGLIAVIEPISGTWQISGGSQPSPGSSPPSSPGSSPSGSGFQPGVNSEFDISKLILPALIVAGATLLF